MRGHNGTESAAARLHPASRAQVLGDGCAGSRNRLFHNSCRTRRRAPVSAAWSISTRPSLTMQSAGTALPLPSSTQSPGTSSDAFTATILPSRFAVASGFSDALRAATALPDFIVSYQPIVALVSWMPRRIAASIQFWMPSSMMIAILHCGLG